MTKATRVRRRRIRRATGRAAWAAVLAAGVLLYSEVSGGAMTGGPSPAVRLEASPVRVVGPLTEAAPAEDVGIWVVEGSRASGAIPQTGDPAVKPAGQPSVRAARVVVLGKDHDVVTNAASVGQLLSAMGIKPDRNDRVSPPPRTPLSPHHKLRIQVVDVSFRTFAAPAVIPYSTQTDYTRDLPPGEVKVVRAGRTGREIVTYRRRIEDGKLVSSRVVSREVTREPVNKLRRVGTYVPDSRNDGTETGNASWYDHPGLTAASPWLPFGTEVTVENLSNGKTVTVVINDRGPFGGGIIDLSDEAFAQIAPLGAGIVRVRLTW